jgi:rare lipoprotein A (peptidoglycan hydrolase)
MILRRISSDARTIASGLLMLCGALTHAKAQVTLDRDTQPALVEATAADTAKKDTETGDVVIRQRGVASWYGRAWRGRRTASGTPFDDRAMRPRIYGCPSKPWRV